MEIQTPPLPIEILVKIFDYVSFDDLIQAGTVCKDWRIGSEDNHIWLEHYSKQIGKDPLLVHESSSSSVFYKQKYINHIKNLLGNNDFNLTMPSTTVFANCMGQRLRGLIIFKAKKDLVADGVFLRIYCEEKTAFMKFVTDEYKTSYRYDTVSQTPFNKTFKIKVNPDQSQLKFSKGVHCFRVDIPFPHSGQNGEYLSGSMQSADRGFFDVMNGSITYGVEAFIGDEAGAKKLKQSTVILKALPKYDIRDELHKSKQIKASKESYSFFGMFHEYTLAVTCPSNVLVLGQTAILSITVANSKSKPVSKLQIFLRSLSYCPQSLLAKESPETIADKLPSTEEMSWTIDFPVPARETKTHQIDLRIPKDLGQSILYSRVMQTRHYLYVKLASGPLLRLPVVVVGTPRLTDLDTCLNHSQ